MIGSQITFCRSLNWNNCTLAPKHQPPLNNWTITCTAFGNLSKLYATRTRKSRWLPKLQSNASSEDSLTCRRCYYATGKTATWFMIITEFLLLLHHRDVKTRKLQRKRTTAMHNMLRWIHKSDHSRANNRKRNIIIRCLNSGPLFKRRSKIRRRRNENR